MNLRLDVERGSAVLLLSARLYPGPVLRQALEAAPGRPRARRTGDGRVEVELAGPKDAEALRALAGEFLNEALSALCRRDTMARNRGIVRWLAGRALLSARQTPEQERRGRETTERLSSEAEALMREAGAADGGGRP